MILQRVVSHFLSTQIALYLFVTVFILAFIANQGLVFTFNLANSLLLRRQTKNDTAGSAFSNCCSSEVVLDH
jgi:hypothetical protein